MSKQANRKGVVKRRNRDEARQSSVKARGIRESETKDRCRYERTGERRGIPSNRKVYERRRAAASEYVGSGGQITKKRMNRRAIRQSEDKTLFIRSSKLHAYIFLFVGYWYICCYFNSIGRFTFDPFSSFLSYYCDYRSLLSDIYIYLIAVRSFAL